MEELKPCPFCGGEPELEWNWGGLTKKYGVNDSVYYLYVSCPSCGARSRATSIIGSGVNDRENYRKPICSWNRRVNDGV